MARTYNIPDYETFAFVTDAMLDDYYDEVYDAGAEGNASHEDVEKELARINQERKRRELNGEKK